MVSFMIFTASGQKILDQPSYLFLFVLSVLVYGLLPPSEHSIAVSNNNNSNNMDHQH